MNISNRFKPNQSEKFNKHKINANRKSYKFNNYKAI